MTVRFGVSLFVSIWHRGGFSSVRECAGWSRLIVCAGIGSAGLGRGRGFWLGMASVQRFCEECEEGVTFLYEKMNVMIGVSDVGNH
jgi:hypothetical protein